MKKRKWTEEEIDDWMRKNHNSILYFNPMDTNIFIRKRFGYGWMINWGNNKVYIAIICLVVLGLLINLLQQ